MPSKENYLSPAECCTGFYLRRAARAVQRLYDRELAKAGLRGTQFTLLNAAFLRSPTTINDLADALAMDRTTLTRNLAPLETKGWVAVDEGDDRRTRWVSVTKAGKLTLEAALPHWQAAQAQTETALGASAMKNLRGSLKKLEALAD